jgi:hypothetical protein
MASPATTLTGASGNIFVDILLSGAKWDLDANRVLTWGTGDNATYFWVNPTVAQAILQPAFDA